MLLTISIAAAAPIAVAPTPTGAIVVLAEHDPAAHQTHLLTQALSPAGQPMGAPVSLQQTPGQVLKAAIAADDAAVWLAWVSMLQAPDADQPGRFVAEARQLAPTPGTTVSLGSYHLGGHPEHGAVAVAVAEDGGTWVAAADTTRPCRPPDAPGEEPCLGYAVYRLDSGAREAIRIHTGALSGGPELTIEGLIDTPSGPALSAWAWRGGANVDALWLTEPARALPSCRPPMARAWVADHPLTLCPASFGPDDCPVGSDGTCFMAIDAAGEHALTDWRLSCTAAGPVVALSWSGGEASWPIQSAEQGAPFGLGAWAGEVFVALVGGAVEVAPCPAVPVRGEP
jgi:hypothetical protein